MKKMLKHLAALLMVVCILNGIPSAAMEMCGNQAYAASSSADRYCRTKLTNDSQKYIYDTYLAALKKGKTVCTFDDKTYQMSEDNFVVAEYAIFMDYPELLYWQNYKSVFWWRGTESDKKIYKVEISYNKTLKSKAKEYEARANAIVASIPKACKTDFEKARYLQDFLCDITNYVDRSTPETPHLDQQQTCFGPILFGESVCEGYARAYQDLLRRAGIRALTVYGYHKLTELDSIGQTNSYIEHDGGIWAGHAWNVLWLDGKCYYADPTFADRKDGTYSYGRFCKSREEFDETYFACESENPDPAITNFLSRVYGTCKHKSLQCVYDDAVTLADPLTDGLMEEIAGAFGPVEAYTDTTDGLKKYKRSVYLYYAGKEAELRSWVKSHTWEIQEAAGITGSKRWFGIEKEEEGCYRYDIIGLETSQNLASAKLEKPVKAVLRDTEKKQNRLLWYPVKGAKKYVVSRKAGKNGTYKKIAETSKLKYTDKNLKAGVIYYYKVEAKK